MKKLFCTYDIIDAKKALDEAKVYGVKNFIRD